MKNVRTAVVISEIIEKAELAAGIFIMLLFGFWLAVFCVIGKYKLPIAIFAVFMIFGILLIFISRRRKKQFRTFREYVARLSNDPSGSIEALARGVNKLQETVRANLQKFINKKYFINAYLNLQENRIVFPAGENREEKEFTTVTCKSCGGVNKVEEGKVSQCEYCGSFLTGVLQ